MYPKAFFTSNVIAPTTEAKFYPPPPQDGIESLQPFDRFPEVIGEPQPFANGLRTITVAAFTPDGSELPQGTLGYLCRVNSAGTLTRVRAITGTDPVIAVNSTMRPVIEKVETDVPVGFDLDGYYASTQSSN